MKAWTSGNVAGTGTFRCTDCDYPVSLDAVDELPTCPNCGGTEFVRASLFTTAQTSIVELTAGSTMTTAWLEETPRGPRATRASTSPTAPTTSDVVAYALQREWTRIGRSLAADIRFDDPTVSRRHALIVRQPDGLRVLDDRSLNGVFVNGERVEWSTLADGDEIVIGRHRLYFVDLPRVSGVRYRRRDRDRHGLSDSRASGGSRGGGPLPIVAPMAATIAVLSQKGGTGKTTAVRTLDRRIPPDRASRAGGRPRPAGQPVRLPRRRPGRRPRRSATCSPAGRRPQEAVHDGIIPANLGLAEAELILGGKMGRELALKRALGELQGRLRHDPDRLPAVARAADRQRARRLATTRCSRPRRSTSRCRASSRRSR